MMKSTLSQSISSVVAQAKVPDHKEDLSEWSLEEHIALACAYTGITKRTFGIAGKKTDRVLALLAKYPGRDGIYPIPIATLVITINKMVRSRPSHDIDVTPKLSGSSFVTHTNSEYETTAVYAKSKQAKCVLQAQRDDRLSDPSIYQLPTTVVSQYGICSEESDQSVRSRQRVAAMVNSMVMPGKENRGFQPTVTKSSTAFASEVVSSTSTLVSSVLGAVTDPTTTHSLYDEMMDKDDVYDFFARTAATTLVGTVYEDVADTGLITDVCEPPEYASYKDPIATIVELAPTIQPRRVGKETSNMFDGLPVNADMRRRMSQLGDIYLPDDVKYVYLDTKNASAAKTLLKRHPEKLMVVYYRSPLWIDNVESEKDYVERANPKDENSEVKILKRGVVQWYGTFVPPSTTGSMYIQLKTSTASGVTAKTLENGTHTVNRQDAEKFKLIPDVQYFLVSTHVYALNPDLFVDGAGTPRYGDYFYVSRRFHSCNVLNANFQARHVDSFDRREILDVFVHLLRWALAYPLTRAICAQMTIDGEVKRIVPSVNFYPFSARAEMREIAASAKRKKVVIRSTPYVYQVAPTTDNSSLLDKAEKREEKVEPPKSDSKRGTASVKLKTLFGKPVPTPAVNSSNTAVDEIVSEDESDDDW